MGVLMRLLICVPLLMVSPVYGDQPKAGHDLPGQLAPFIKRIAGAHESFSLVAEVDYVDGDESHKVTLNLTRIDDEAFDLDVRHQKYRAKLYRRADRTVLILPRHKTAFVGEGELRTEDTIRPAEITSRLIGPGTVVAAYMPVWWTGNPTVVSTALQSLLPLTPDDADGVYKIGDEASVRFDSATLTLKQGESTLRAELTDVAKPADIESELAGVEVTQIERDEIERTICRGARRALEVLAPSPMLTMPVQRDQKIAHGQLRWIDGQRVALLSGSPEQIGHAHGQLLEQETLRCVDSVIHMFGLVRTIESGNWFRQNLNEAYRRLKPHIPADHLQETDALADSIGWDRKLVQAVNVFPELFHCSGFAVFGSATRGGKLYHGRVLDYMTTIGLQDSATTFVIAPDGKIPFATVGYAGFIGSVSGMNNHGISLGEMGGRGEGQWDGVPMATLMRRALEECSTLLQVKSLWRDSPRTCEYYYVFADGNANDAVGVAATPQSIQFVDPGQAHPLLGEGIKDAVVLSADERLKTLRGRVQQHHGKIDLEIAKWLMSRPVAMKSNLHNVLFVPQDGVMYVANADHNRPAAETPYARIDLRSLLKSINASAPTVAAVGAE